MGKVSQQWGMKLPLQKYWHDWQSDGSSTSSWAACVCWNRKGYRKGDDPAFENWLHLATNGKTCTYLIHSIFLMWEAVKSTQSRV